MEINKGTRANSSFILENGPCEVYDVYDTAFDPGPLNLDIHNPSVETVTKLAVYFASKFLREGEMVDIDRAVNGMHTALSLSQVPSPALLLNLSNMYTLRYNRTGADGSTEDLDKAIAAAETGVELANEIEDSSRYLYMMDLAKILSFRYVRTARDEDLNRSIMLAESSLEGIAPSSTNYVDLSVNMARMLGMRFQRTSRIGDINRAIKLASIIETAPSLSPVNRATLTNIYSSLLEMRAESSGSDDDLNLAIEMADRATFITPENHPERASWLNNLGNLVMRRFQRRKAIADLDRGIDLAQKAVDATPPNHIYRASRLANLAQLLSTRSEHFEIRKVRGEDDLERARKFCESGLKLIPPNDPALFEHRSLLSSIIMRQYYFSQKQCYLDQAIDIADDLLAKLEDEGERKTRMLYNISIYLGVRYDAARMPKDLDRAIELGDLAVKAVQNSDFYRVEALQNIGKRYLDRFALKFDDEDAEKSITALNEGSASATGRPYTRIKMAALLGRLFAVRKLWKDSSKLLGWAVEMLPSLSPRSLENADKLNVLADFSGLAADAAAFALNAGQPVHRALELLEIGRGISASLLFDMRTDISALEEQHPALAAEFAVLRGELDWRPGYISSHDTAELSAYEVQAKYRREADKRFDSLVEQIQKKKGFEEFLRPISEDACQRAASRGPIVVINLSRYRCDAILIQHDRPLRVLNLPDLKLQDVKDKVKLRSGKAITIKLLEWLWDVCVHRILDMLGFQEPPPSGVDFPHVWWVPIGAFSGLPLHAAGYHTRGTGETVLDRVMSSYSSSVRAIIEGQLRPMLVSSPVPHQAVKHTPAHALLVAMKHTQRQSKLKYAEREIEILQPLCQSMNLEPLKLKRRYTSNILRHLSGDVNDKTNRETEEEDEKDWETEEEDENDKDSSDYIDNSSSCAIFHFAGHGRSNNGDPSQSSLLLDNGEELTVAALIKLNLLGPDRGPPPFLAYLSACSTGKGSEKDRFADEGMHLISACQLAGFRHVVGTLWEVDDEACVEVARLTYETIRDGRMCDESVCKGVHTASRELRSRWLRALKPMKHTTGSGDDGKSRKNAVAVMDYKMSGLSLDEESKTAGLVATKDDKNSDSKADGRGDRDVIFDAEEVELLMYWAPYVHYGV